jgi:hypothetical protein
MRVYQPVLTDQEWESGVLSSFEVYRYFDSAKKDFPNHTIAVFEEEDIEDPTFVDKRRIKIELWYDTIPSNPWTDWDCEFPLMYSSGRNEGQDYSEGDIDRYLMDLVREKFSLDKIIELADPQDFDRWYPEDEYTEEDRLDFALDALEEWLTDSVEHRGELAEELDIKYYQGLSRGYSQSDWAEVFICWTPEYGKLGGLKYEKVTDQMLESSFQLFTDFAWGDVFGFTVSDSETDDLIDSCGGFYGRDWENNGILDYIRGEGTDDKTDEELIEILENLEIQS